MMRRNSLGFVYQKIYLLPEFTALENVIIPQVIKGVRKNIALVPQTIFLNDALWLPLPLV